MLKQFWNIYKELADWHIREILRRPKRFCGLNPQKKSSNCIRLATAGLTGISLAFTGQADAKGAPVGTKYILNTSAYSSTVSQTDSTPFITATGSRVRPGVLAVSRDMLGWAAPHGTRLKAVAQRGCGINVVGRVFYVEDTMGPRSRRAADIWFGSTAQARKFGRCSVTFIKQN